MLELRLDASHEFRTKLGRTTNWNAPKLMEISHIGLRLRELHLEGALPIEGVLPREDGRRKERRGQQRALSNYFFGFKLRNFDDRRFKFK